MSLKRKEEEEEEGFLNKKFVTIATYVYNECKMILETWYLSNKKKCREREGEEKYINCSLHDIIGQPSSLNTAATTRTRSPSHLLHKLPKHIISSGSLKFPLSSHRYPACHFDLQCIINFYSFFLWGSSRLNSQWLFAVHFPCINLRCRYHNKPPAAY